MGCFVKEDVKVETEPVKTDKVEKVDELYKESSVDEESVKEQEVSKECAGKCGACGCVAR
jgi:hypothetical protein